KTPSYTLEEVSVSAVYPREMKPFRMYEYEISGFDRGELRFSITEDVVRQDPLVMKINGNTVFEGTPIKRALPYTQTFHANTTGLTAGENVLSLSTSGRSSYPLENLQMTFYYVAGTQQRTVVRHFILSGSEYSSLSGNGGILEMEVDSVTLQRPVTVKLPDAEFTRTLNAGTNTFKFGKQAVHKGENTLTISTDGSYRVSNLTISAAE
ncbi:MAG: hypothetical protein SVS85_02205, partial [Candidatus Nanohaloarchaea archaeon]|nr:hypothetical protein [Candidatus Nanohaloarchaea archaeon]